MAAAAALWASYLALALLIAARGAWRFAAGAALVGATIALWAAHDTLTSALLSTCAALLVDATVVTLLAPLFPRAVLRAGWIGVPLIAVAIVRELVGL